MTAPDHMPEAFENSLHETGHPHMSHMRLSFGNSGVRDRLARLSSQYVT
jgi:hypothetical protein